MTASSELAGRRVLVTGASGYLGAATIARLCAIGSDVVGVSRSRPRVAVERWRAADLAAGADLESAFAAHRPEIVLHLAGETGAARDPARIVSSFVANGLGTVRLLDAARRYGARRFVYCASMEEPLMGTASSVPASPYGASKWVGSIYTRLYGAQFGLQSVIVRPYFVYGPGEQPREKLVPSLIRAYLDGIVPTLASPGRAMDWVFIDDVVEGFVRAAGADRAAGTEIGLGTGALHTIAEFVDVVRRSFPGAPSPARQSDPLRANESSPIADVAACRAILGWTPSTSLADGVSRTVDWYRAHSS